jgi:hypothetical protein
VITTEVRRYSIQIRNDRAVKRLTGFGICFRFLRENLIPTLPRLTIYLASQPMLLGSTWTILKRDAYCFANKSLDMWLLDTKSIRLNAFNDESRLPPYAILSHRWEEDEVTFQEIHKPEAQRMHGYKKILYCCKQARIDNLDWAWVDT